jgi:hypothetical protein
VSGRIEPSEAQGKRTPATTSGNVGNAIGFNYTQGAKAKGIGAEFDRSITLKASGASAAVCYDITHADAVIRESHDVVPTLKARMGTGGNNTPLVMDNSNETESPLAFHLTQDVIYGEVAPCLTGGNPARGQATVGVMQSEVPPINAECYAVGNGQVAGTCLHSVAGALNCMHDQQAIMNNSKVRRLTPLECERLQGYPDNWTNIGTWTDSAGKKHDSVDTIRYKAIGNSIAIPPWKWVLKRICAMYERNATMASLFDGIGGFPYIWEQLNGKGTCLWASEIEEFAIAVTKRHFGE